MNTAKNRKITYSQGTTLALGVSQVAQGVQFAVSLPDCQECSLILYQKGYKKPYDVIVLDQTYKRGSVFFVTVTGFVGEELSAAELADRLSREYEYMFRVGEREFVDPYATAIHGREHWGKPGKTRENLRGGIGLEAFHWENDAPPAIAFRDLILYQLHVRGFTNHRSSRVQARGTFRGLQEKIPYIKDLGVNAVMLLPCYDFQEIMESSKQVIGEPKTIPQTAENQMGAEMASCSSKTRQQQDVKINYWGYGSTDNYYFAPKAGYASDKQNAAGEMKTLVKQFHAQGIEVLLDIYFAPGTNLHLMTDCLRHWVMNYHIDGFRVNQEVMPAISMVSDPILAGVKLLTSYWDQNMLMQSGVIHQENALAEYNEGYMNDVRRFLKSDEGQVGNFVERFRRNPRDYSVINFLAHVNGFTMMDLVSYDVKHNEDNGEMNQDGAEINYSWNCGVEGKSRKKTILARRQCQIRNAFLMLLFSQGTPMILAGDEFGNSQKGNNNPYCQDNAITWLDWNHTDYQKEILEYVRKLIAFRKKHPVLHQEKELLQMDTLSCGMPDLSVHSTQAWKGDYSHYNRMLGLLLYGDYAKLPDGSSDDSIYLIFNMYWEPRSFDLPNLPGDRQWYVAIETYSNTFSPVPAEPARKPKKKRASLVSQKKTIVPPRSIVVFVGK